MKDHYPHLSGVPRDCLVPPEYQPDYTPVAMPDGEDRADAGYRLADAHVTAGRGNIVAALHAESGRAYSYADLARESNRLAAGLCTLGVKVGDRIAYQSVNDPVVLIVMLAIWKAGGVVVPIPSYTGEKDLPHFLEDTGARFYFIHDHVSNSPALATTAQGVGVEGVFMFAPEPHEGVANSWETLLSDESAHLPQIDPDQVAIIWHTGGTTGRPKGCYHTHRRFLLAGYSFGEGCQVKPGQVWSATAPIGHALGIIHHTIFSLLNGATVLFIEDFANPATVLAAVAGYRVTTLTGLMASWDKMAMHIQNHPEQNFDTSSLERCYAMWQTSSASMVYDFWQERGVELFNNYGSTSFANWVLAPKPGEATPRAAIGRALPHYHAEAVEVTNGKIRVLEQGEIGQLAVKGPSGLTYWNLPDLQRRDVVDGWTLSDDLVQFDSDGIAHYLGRSDYMISTGGYKVAPVEVEQVLARHPAVREVAVVPAPCPTRMEKVAAYISLNPGYIGDTSLENELVQAVKAELTFYKVPRLIRFIDALPRDAVGKVQTNIVKGWASAKDS